MLYVFTQGLTFKVVQIMWLNPYLAYNLLPSLALFVANSLCSQTSAVTLVNIMSKAKWQKQDLSCNKAESTCKTYIIISWKATKWGHGKKKKTLTRSNLILPASMMQHHHSIQYSSPSVVCCHCRTWLQAEHTVVNMELLERRMYEGWIECGGRKDTDWINWVGKSESIMFIKKDAR